MLRTVSLHLRTRRIAGSQQGAAVFVRLLSKLVAALDGRYTAQTAKHVHDVKDHTSRRLAMQADKLLSIQVERLRQSVYHLKVYLACMIKKFTHHNQFPDWKLVNCPQEKGLM